MRRLKTNGFGMFLHALAILTLACGLFIGFLETPTSMQQTVQALWQLKYILYAIFYEIAALSCRNYIE